MTARRLAAILLALLACVGTPAHAQEPTPPDREMVRVTGDLYRVRAGRQHTVFLVTPDGIVLADPLGAATAAWLEEEVGTRFPGPGIRVVILTTQDYLRADGSALLNDFAEIVAHARSGEVLARARRSLPPDLVPLDRNKTKALDYLELEAAGDPARLLTRDGNGDRLVTTTELYSGVAEAERRFGERDTIRRGGRAVEVVHVGAAHAPDMSVLVYPAERVAFAAEVPPLATDAGFGHFSPGDALHWAVTVDGLAFDTLLSGDGQSLTHAEITALRGYLQDLTAEVTSGYESGRSLSAVQEGLGLAAHRETPYFAGRRAQTAALFPRVTLRTADIYGGWASRTSSENPAFCGGYASCRTSVGRSAVMMGARVSTRRLGIAAELTRGAQASSGRAVPFLVDDLVQRETRGSLLGRWQVLPGAVSTAIVFGPSLMITDVQGVAVTPSTLAPPGGRTPIAERWTRVGVTVGADFVAPLGGSLRLLVPIRFTRRFGTQVQGPDVAGTTDVQVGVGLAFRTFKRLLVN